MFTLKTILYPTDFSKPSEVAFQFACSMARDHGAQVIIMHVAPPMIVAGEVMVPLPPEDYKAQIWESFRKLQATDPRARELRVETRLAEGDPAYEIVVAAKETGADLIVMGTHGRTGLSRLILGSVAEHVLRKSPCPVLTVKAPIMVSAEPAPKLVATH
jgi:nucleotide-binding universal stress UspA family protein